MLVRWWHTVMPQEMRNMIKNDNSPPAHLIVGELSVPAGEEWVSRLGGWTVLQVNKGTGYYLQPQSNQALEAGSVLLVAGSAGGSIRASQLSELSFHSFRVMPSRLAGLITLGEQSSLDLAITRNHASSEIFPPNSPVAEKMRELFASPKREGLLFRLKLLQVFVEAVGNGLEHTVVREKTDGDFADAKQRLEVLLKQTPASELLEMNFNELAQMTRCTTRHLSRIFHELVGMSFRDKRAELRLARARELLANSDSKVVDVALESGYKSLSLFNLMFARRYGVSPGRWRQKNGNSRKMLPVNLQRSRGFKINLG